MYLFVEPTVNSLQNLLTPQNTTLTTKLDFFGEEKKWLFSGIDLVAHIGDPKQELLSFNKKIKKDMHHSNKEYKRAYNMDLYDIAKSENFPYLSHISLGHLRTNYIKHLINDPSKADKIVDRIKQQILEIVSGAIAKLSPDDRKLSFDDIAIYDANQRKYVHKRALK